MLDRVETPQDLKGLDLCELRALAQDIRNVLIKKASTYGGHVGSNLGIVEATIALHYVFESPKDKFVFDVSHQCYPHKILTGRKNAFLNPDDYSKVNGFTNPDESEHDLFKIGHSATSISLACGLAKARDLLGRKENIVAVIGDAALGGGEALEGLNFAGSELKTNLIIVVNDNQMSIAEDHGGLYRALSLLRESCGESENNIFKALGFKYRFVCDGNDLKPLIDTFAEVKDCSTPTVVHIVTKKGKGYSFAENDQESWHWRRPFDIQTGELLNPYKGKSYDRILNDYLLNKMKSDKTVVAFAAGVPLTSGFSKDKREIAGSQFVDVGIMEEHAIGMIAGVATNGGKPVFTTDCTFYQRVYDQISHDVCINKLPVTMLVRNATIWGMTDITHLGFFDIAIFSNIPNLVYLAPTNQQEYISMLDWSIDQDKYPVMIRIPRYVTDAKYPVSDMFDEINVFQTVKQGERVAVIAAGDFFQLGDELVDRLNLDMGIQATLINPRYLSGVDAKLLEQVVKQHELIITMEDGVIEGGFGQKVASFCGRYRNVIVKNYGLRKEFLDRYRVDQVLVENHLTIDLLLQDIQNMLADEC